MKKNRPSRPFPRLKMIATGWTFSNYPNAAKPWKEERILAEIEKAGFDGIQTRMGLRLAELARKHGLTVVIGRDIGSVGEVEPRLKEIKNYGGYHINVQLCDHDTPVEKSLPITVRVMEVGDKLGLLPAIEWHRDTCTETPEKALALAQAYQKQTGRKLRMNFDHSHPAIIKHLHPGNYWERLGVRLDLLRMGGLIHFRPFNGHHCQIPVTDGKGNLSPEMKDWLPFCDKVIGAWMEQAAPERELYVVPELGPTGGYCLSCFPDRWQDKQVLAGEIRKIWAKHLRRWKAKRAPKKRV